MTQIIILIYLIRYII